MDDVLAGVGQAADPADEEETLPDVTVYLYNATNTSGGTGPGQVTVPAAEGQACVDAGYAVFVPDGGP